MPSRLIHSSGAGGTCGAGGPSPRLSLPIASSNGCGHGASKSIPHPSRNVSTSWSVIGRSAGTVAPSSRAATVDQHLAVGELRQQRVDWIVEPELALLDEDQRRHRSHRLGHRGDAKDAVAAHRLGLATGEVPGDAELDIVATSRQPRHARDRVLLGMAGHHVTQSRDPCRRRIHSSITDVRPQTSDGQVVSSRPSRCRPLASRRMPYVADPGRYESMVYRRCGRSGVRLPAISLGLWHNFGDDRPWETQRAICRRAFDLGVTHFDLANNYGPPYGAAESNFGRISANRLRRLSRRAAHLDQGRIRHVAGPLR